MNELQDTMRVKESNCGQAQKPGHIVNYLWMREDPSQPYLIPSYLFYRVQINAARYPEAEFRVWGDNEDIVCGYEIPNNIKICELNGVSSFASVPVLQSTDRRDLWTKVDMARLLVVQQVLEDRPEATVVYSDFDIRDVSLRSRRLRSRIKTYGCAMTGSIDPKTKKLFTPFENSYFAFSFRGSALLEFIVDQCKQKIKPQHNRKDKVYDEIKSAMDEWAFSNRVSFPHTWREDIASLPFAYPSGWRNDKSLKAKPERPSHMVEQQISDNLAA